MDKSFVLRCMPRRMLGQLAAWALVAAMGSAIAADIHMSPNGNDRASGASREQAVATLARAFELATTDRRRKSEPMRIVVGRGTYTGQSVVLDGKQLGYELTLIGEANDPKDFPTFAGDGIQVTWLTVKSDRGHRTGLTIQALEVRDYATATSLEGNRDSPDRHNAGTTIRRNVFRNIGSIAMKNVEVSTAAIRFVNSRDNVVEQNHFRTIRNKNPKRCGGLHALYVAHFSSGNRIANNTFVDACGSVVKLRDRSNDNVVEGNRFTQIENAPVIEEWYCDKVDRKDCTKKLGECPSTGNVERKNVQSESTNSEYLSVVGGRVARPWCAPADFSRDRVRSN